MNAYVAPSWAFEALSVDPGAWSAVVDWVTIVATVLIAAGTTLASSNRT